MKFMMVTFQTKKMVLEEILQNIYQRYVTTKAFIKC